MNGHITYVVINEKGNVGNANNELHPARAVKIDKDDLKTLEIVVTRNSSRDTLGNVVFSADINDRYKKDEGERVAIRKLLTKWVENSYDQYLRVFMITKSENEKFNKTDYSVTIFEEAFIQDYVENNDIYSNGEYSVVLKQKAKSNITIIDFDSNSLMGMKDEELRAENLVELTAQELRGVINF